MCFSVIVQLHGAAKQKPLARFDRHKNGDADKHISTFSTYITLEELELFVLIILSFWLLLLKRVAWASVTACRMLLREKIAFARPVCNAGSFDRIALITQIARLMF